jgi:hypothetical protein
VIARRAIRLVAVGLVGAALSAGCARPVDLAASQERARALTGPLGPAGCNGQFFVAGRDGLSTLEVMLEAPPGAPPVRLTLYEDPPGQQVAGVSATPSGPGMLRFDFPAQGGSRGRRYRFCLDADAPTAVRAWYAPDLARPGEPRTEGGREAVGALAFRARYLPSPPVVLSDAAETARRSAGVLAVLALAVLGPGLALSLAALGPVGRDDALGGAADLLAAAPGGAALSIALLWWIATLARWPVDARLLVAVLAFGVVASAVGLLRRRGRAQEPAGHERGVGPRRGGGFDLAWLLALWAAALVVRLAVVRDLALPAWIDAPQHGYLTERLIAARGVPDDFGPLVDAAPFSYHFGFHALAATASLITGAAPADAVLVTGQFLSAAAAPTAYLLVRLYRGSPTAGLAAAALAGLVSVMPSYYVSWSRFTQLAGLIAAPTWLAIVRRTGAGPAAAAAAGAASAALLLVHPRIAVMAALLAAVDALCLGREWSWRWRWLGLGGALGLGLSAPWLWRLVGGLLPRMSVGLEAASAANTLDLAPLSTGSDPELYGAAAAVAVAGVLAGRRSPLAALLWLGLVAAFSNSARLGLPGGAYLGNPAVLISLWLPAAALVGAGVGAALDAIGPRLRPAARRWLHGLVPPLLLVAGCALSGDALASLNPSTVLATERDRRVLERLDEVVPADDLIAVNSRPWQFSIHAGADAGAWIGVATRARAIVPPVLYALEPAERFTARSERLAGWEAADGDPAALAERMRLFGARWLFVGERGGAVDAGALTPDAGFELVLADGGARLFRLRDAVGRGS